MKEYLFAFVISSSMLLSSCAALEQERQAYFSRRAAVMLPGTPQAEVLAVWGNPYNTTHASNGTIDLDILQFGSCAASPGLTAGVIFMRFVNGKLTSYSTTHC